MTASWLLLPAGYLVAGTITFRALFGRWIVSPFWLAPVALVAVILLAPEVASAARCYVR
ncbi:MAG TPA: hypothetical protein VN803_03010 [Gemmatimonadales bacterium]|nr:hypothetical protein [Gemmatimonadales bacterium]